MAQEEPLHFVSRINLERISTYTQNSIFLVSTILFFFFYRGPDWFIREVIGFELDDRRIEVCFLAEARRFFRLLHSTQIGSEVSQPHIRWIPVAPQGVKRPGREVDH